MNETVREWFDKSDGDFRTASRELGVADEPNYDAVCYHAQQSVEKLMKGLLILRGVVPPRSHDLVLLHGLLADKYSEWKAEEVQLRFLMVASVAFRYPGERAEHDDAAEALQVCSDLRDRLNELRPGTGDADSTPPGNETPRLLE